MVWIIKKVSYELNLLTFWALNIAFSDEENESFSIFVVIPIPTTIPPIESEVIQTPIPFQN